MKGSPSVESPDSGSAIASTREWVQLMTAALDAAPNTIVITDDKGVIKWVNPSFTKDTGYSFEEAIGQNPRILKSGKQSDEYYAEMWRVISSGKPWRGEFVNRRKNGELYTEDVNVAPVRDSNGVVRHYIAIKYDITLRKRAEDELRLFRTLVDASEDSFEVVDPETGRFLDISAGHCEKLGYTRDEMLALRVSDIETTVTQADWPRVMEMLRKAGNQVGQGRHRCKDGSVFPVEYHVKLVRLDRDYIIGVVHDVTEQKKLEEQLLRAQRLESLGMLAAGIAHDLNNILSPIAMAVPLLRANAFTKDDLQVLNTVESCTRRGSGLVRQILNFVHGIGGEPSVLNVGHVMRDLVGVLSETFPKSVTVTCDVQRDLWPVLANPTHIHQVLLNLGVNARDAMPAGGSLHFRAGNCILEESSVQAIKASQPGMNVKTGAWIVLHVSDTGSGIPPGIVSRIWDPFFSTKGAQKGTGLGLSTVGTILRAHHGFCTLQTELGRGTTFHVYLPAVEAPGRDSTHPFAENAPRGNGETILLVDDEREILETATSILIQGGYRVVSAANGAEACAIFESRCSEIALVVTDQDMPELDGTGLIRFIRKSRPDFKVLVTSGLTGSSGTSSSDDMAAPFLSKPFTSFELLNEIHRLLSSKSAPL